MCRTLGHGQEAWYVWFGHVWYAWARPRGASEVRLGTAMCVVRLGTAKRCVCGGVQLVNTRVGVEQAKEELGTRQRGACVEEDTL